MPLNKISVLSKWPLFLICIFYFNLNMVAQCLIKGSVIDQKNKPIVNASVLVHQFQNEWKMHSFDISDGQGLFKTKLEVATDSILVIVRSMGFQQLDTVVYVSKMDSVQLDLVLEEDVVEFEEVVIKAKASAFEMRGDTIFYHIDNFIEDPDESIEELIARLPGIDLDKSTGKITHLGKEVSYLLVDGDNLSGQSPKQVMQLLQSKDLVGIQTIQSFVENPIYNGFSSDQTALNVQLKDSLIIKKNVQIEGGWLTEDGLTGRFTPDFVFMKKKQKLVLSSGIHNTGVDLSRSEFDMNGVNGMQTSNMMERVFIPARIFNPMLDQRSYMQNNQSFAKLQYLNSKRKKTKLRLAIDANSLNELVNNSSIEEYFTGSQLDNRIEINRYNDINRKFIKLNSSLDIKHSKNRNSFMKVKAHRMWANNQIQQIQPDVTLGSNNIDYLGSSASMEYRYTSKIAKETIFQTEATAEYILSNQNGSYISDFEVLPTAFQSEQDLNQELSRLQAYSEIVKKFGNIELKSGLKGSHKNQFFSNSLVNPFLFQTTERAFQRNQIQFSKLGLYQIASIPLGPVKISLSHQSYYQNYSILSTEYVKLQSKNLFSDASLGLSYFNRKNNKWEMKFSQAFKEPSIEMQLQSPIQISNREFLRGVPTTDFVRTQSVELSHTFSGSDVDSGNGFFTLTYSRHDQTRIIKQKVELINFVTEFDLIDQPSNQVFLLYNHQRLSIPLQAKFTFFTSVMYNEFFSSVNSEAFQESQMLNISPSLKIEKLVSDHIHFDIEGQLHASRFESINAGRVDLYGLNLESSLQLLVGKAFKVRFSHRYIHTDLSQSTNFNLYNLESSYKIKGSPLQIGINVYNIGNTKYYEQRNLGDFYESTRRLHLNPLYANLSIKYQFR